VTNSISTNDATQSTAGNNMFLSSFKERYLDINSQCVVQYSYWWQWLTVDHGGNSGAITSPTPLGQHRFGVQRRTDGCAPGASWCWHFRIDSVTKHTCCYLPDVFTNTSAVYTQIYCVDDNLNTDCPVVGEVSPWNGFQYKNAVDVWIDWFNKDFACVDYDRSARGKWLSDTSADGGFNITFSNSLTNHCQ
jgi:hypothetical protein